MSINISREGLREILFNNYLDECTEKFYKAGDMIKDILCDDKVKMTDEVRRDMQEMYDKIEKIGYRLDVNEENYLMHYLDSEE